MWTVLELDFISWRDMILWWLVQLLEISFNEFDAQFSTSFKCGQYLNRRKASPSMEVRGKTLEQIINNELITATEATPLGDRGLKAFDGCLLVNAI